LTPPQINNRPVRRLFGTFALASVLLLLCLVALRFGGASVWDDAYFNVRYADHLLDNGNFAWNADESPAYGLTSILHGLVVLVLRFGIGGSPALPLILASLLAGVAALSILFKLLSDYGDDLGENRWGAALFFAILLGFNAPPLSVHLTSGMDTALGMAFLGIYLLVIKRFEPSLSPGKSLVVGILGGLAWFVRPDLLIFTIGIPLSLAIFSKKKVQRVQGGYMLIFTAFSLLTQALLTTQTFDSFVPLSFYVKSLPDGAADLREAYQWRGLQYLGTFLAANWAAVGVIFLAVLLKFRSWRKHFTIADKAAMLSLGLFAAYQTFLVIPVMGYHARFLYPAWPILAYLSTRSAVHLLYERPHIAEKIRLRTSGLRQILPLLAFALAIGAAAFLQRPRDIRRTMGQFEMKAVYQQLGLHNWPFLERFSILPDDLSMAATELGILSALNPGKTIYDLSGLNDPILAVDGFDLKRFLGEQDPDLVYLPHPDYKTLTAKLLNSEEFQNRYQIYSSETLGSYLGIALRRTSPYFYQMKNIVEEELAKTQ
jgi:hypothetical protein